LGSLHHIIQNTAGFPGRDFWRLEGAEEGYKPGRQGVAAGNFDAIFSALLELLAKPTRTRTKTRTSVAAIQMLLCFAVTCVAQRAFADAYRLGRGRRRGRFPPDSAFGRAGHAQAIRGLASGLESYVKYTSKRTFQLGKQVHCDYPSQKEDDTSTLLGDRLCFEKGA